MSALSNEVCDQLENNLAKHIHAHGWETFVSAPLLERDAELPEEWLSDLDGVAIIVQRLLAWADEDCTRILISDYTEMSERSSQLASEVQFIGADRDGSIELEVSSLCDGQELIGVLSHEAAGAWLALRQLQEQTGGPFRTEPGIEEADDEASRARASEVAVYLGFGVPAANAADSTRHTGSLEGTIVTTSWGVTCAGGLPVQSMVYLLAVQAVVRDRKDELKLIRKGLHTNQCADFNGWIDQLSDQRSELLERLAIPASDTWPAVQQRSSESLPDCEVVIREQIDRDAEEFFNRGRNVFRLRFSKAMSKTMAGAAGGCVVAVGAAYAGLAAPFAFGLVALSAIAGRIHGSGQYYWECSDSECRSRVGPRQSTCKRCGGTIAGEILKASERLAAEEALEEEALEEED
jgi:hypothetical protein